jgi:hypothetical protein
MNRAFVTLLRRAKKRYLTSKNVLGSLRAVGLDRCSYRFDYPVGTPARLRKHTHASIGPGIGVNYWSARATRSEVLAMFDKSIVTNSK